MPTNTVITPTDVISSFGSYYIDQGQNMDSLLMRPYHAFGTRDAFTNIPTEDTQVRWSDVQVSEILQPYQDTFTPKGSLVFRPVTINLVQVKIDQKFNPNNLVYSWLGFLTSTNTDRSTWPFVRWMIEVYLMKQSEEDMEASMIYTGDQDAIVAGTAGDAADIHDGVKKIINDNIADMEQILTGAFAADPKDFVTQIEEFVKEIPVKYRRMAMTLNTSVENEEKFVEGMQQKYNMNYAQVADIKGVRNFPNIKVAGRISMTGSDKIWATPKWNAVFLTKGFSNANGFQMKEYEREVSLYTDYFIGWGFLLKDLVFTNDQDM